MANETNGSAMLTEETLKSIDHWAAKFPADKKRSALIQASSSAAETITIVATNAQPRS